MPELRCYPRKGFELFHGRRIMHPVNEWPLVQLLVFLENKFRHFTVSKQHKILDQLMRILPLFFIYTQRLAVFTCPSSSRTTTTEKVSLSSSGRKEQS